MENVLGFPEEPAINEFTDKQLKIFWLPEEVNLEKDLQDVLVNFTDSERHGIITTLKLFSIYEVFAGEEFWGGRFKKIFPQIEFQRMGATFSMFELAVHQPFYNKINQLLHIDTPEFYNSYVNDPDLKARIEFIDEVVNHPNPLISLAAFSLIEGVVLYSNFAYLKHFQSQGKNKLLNVVRGLNFSLRDENLHSKAGSWCFRHLAKKTELNQTDWEEIKAAIISVCNKLYEHETLIVKKIFERGRQDGITETQLNHFVQSRINEVLKDLGFDPIFEVKHNPISEWFYKAISDFTFNDFFTGVSAEYQRNWDESKFIWKTAA